MKDAKLEVITQLLETARLIRRRGTPERAEAALPYERLLERDRQQREAELASPVEQPQEQKAA